MLGRILEQLAELIFQRGGHKTNNDIFLAKFTYKTFRRNNPVNRPRQQIIEGNHILPATASASPRDLHLPIIAFIFIKHDIHNYQS